ncbi:hypothetical protein METBISCDRAFT_30453 [Metschnikowia bicuspidata]|uniref:Xylanolytic transcriptional activator regulatory domain-containing protein n=1 Tax=Metschnikowia bicuspidata TaxID=27322 RepID=A0A4P9ZE21_9ASCO|nr:hypothetical protein METBISCDRAFT_30453 [Metschnikowia bicuspidata]
MNVVLGQDSSYDFFETNAKTFASGINKPKNKQVYISSSILERLFQQLPSNTEELIREFFPSIQDTTLVDRFCFYLQCYWDTFQPKLSIFHRPSYSTETAEPLLLLAMLCIGSMYSASSAPFSLQQQMCPEFKFCMKFKPPVAVWVLQTLDLLEEMPERAHIHHGTTVQLLRRSPFLGGNPAVTSKAANSASDTATSRGQDEQFDGVSDLEDQINSDQNVFLKWVNSESMKRITFMTFYLDVIEYIKFRHNPQISYFQHQLLNLPCDEEQLWNNDEVNGSFQKVVKRQKMQLLEFQNIFTVLVSPKDKKRNSLWNYILMRALDDCEPELFSSSAALSSDTVFPMRLDIAIYGGSPRNMSIDATSKDLQLIQRKLHSIWNTREWMKLSNDVANARSVVHCYWLLWKLMLAPLQENGETFFQPWALTLNVEYDVFDSMYAVSIAMQVLWCNTFATCGPESKRFNEVANSWLQEDLRNYSKMHTLCEKNGYQYLARLRHDFVQFTNEIMKRYCEKLPELPNKKSVAGLCFMLGTTFLKSQWELIINCGLRSIGKQTVYCSDLFDNEFKR